MFLKLGCINLDDEGTMALDWKLSLTLLFSYEIVKQTTSHDQDTEDEI